MLQANYSLINTNDEDETYETAIPDFSNVKGILDEYESINTDVDITDSVRRVKQLNTEQRVVVFLAGIFYKFDPLTSSTDLVNAYFAYFKNNLVKGQEEAEDEKQAIKEIDRIRMGYKIALGVVSFLATIGLVFAVLVVMNQFLSSEPHEINPYPELPSP